MAGLNRNTKIKGTGPMPDFPPSADNIFATYYGQGQPYATYAYYPGFNGGTAGRGIMIYQANDTSNIVMYDKNGAVTGGGSWTSSGLTIAEAAGSANADTWVGFYMDNTDAMLYILTSDTSTSPDTLYFSKINEAGTVTAIGNAALASTNLDGMTHRGTNQGRLRRLGGDGSGNFGIYFGKANDNVAPYTHAVPNRGVDIQISASDGSLSYADAMPSTHGSPYYLRSVNMGPTANGIIGGWSYYNGASGDGNTGGFYNTVNGKSASNVQMGTPFSNGTPYLSATPNPVQWRETYILTGNGQAYGSMVYEVSAIHAWMDEMAVYYGIL